MELGESPLPGEGAAGGNIGEAGDESSSQSLRSERAQFREDLIARMRKIEGQARGIQKMLEDRRNCNEIVVQLSAMKAGIDQVAIGILGHYLAYCIEEERAKGKDIHAALEKFMPVFRQFI